MKKILLQLCSDKLANVFDTITAYDMDVDCVLQYGGVASDDVRDLVHGAMFARSGDDLKNTAILVGGSDLSAGEAILQAVRAEFFGPVRVSVMLDSNGCNTTAAAIVTRIFSAGEVAGKKVVVLAGTGPVGLRTAALLAREGAQVTLTSRRLARAEAACASIEERFGVGGSPAEATDAEGMRRALEGACAAIAAGAAGVRLLPETAWVAHPTLRVLADVNAVPPLGIEGIEPAWDGEAKDGKVIFGAYGIGGLKTRVQRACIIRLFERNDLVLDAEEIRAVAREVVDFE
ncbi:MAG: NADP-dependent methylenetetrahydromethanopterin/methylenetetrahydrofolate dehydrogenase [Chloroflexota bacterium]|nr:NADP-dependent methylenetetrahydromethanopterin/methylenetetrahydrofolate dehydrogenase [Chloroflexota bacterium]